MAERRRALRLFQMGILTATLLSIVECHFGVVRNGMNATLVLATINSIDWSKSPGENLVSEQQWAAISRLVDMTPREIETCQFLFAGQKRGEIACELGISERTVRFHMESIHDKLQVKNRVDLILRLIQLRDYVIANDKASSAGVIQ